MQHITFTFPGGSEPARMFFGSLRAILAELPNASISGTDLTLSAVQPKNAGPATRFRLDEQASSPLVTFDANCEPAQLMRRLQPVQPAPATTNPIQDSLGPYYEVSMAKTTLYRLPVTEVQQRLKGHLVRIDHTGVNLPAEHLRAGEWDNLVHTAAARYSLYRYPTGEPWLFIVPATPEESVSDITVFPVGREPRFELVYDTLSPVPQLQIDVETDLERPEVERLFPGPYGVSFPGLADYFRTVYVHHPWPGLAIRFDIRFKSTDPANDWDTGKWLVRDGGRIR